MSSRRQSVEKWRRLRPLPRPATTQTPVSTGLLRSLCSVLNLFFENVVSIKISADMRSTRRSENSLKGRLSTVPGQNIISFFVGEFFFCRDTYTKSILLTKKPFNQCIFGFIKNVLCLTVGVACPRVSLRADTSVSFLYYCCWKETIWITAKAAQVKYDIINKIHVNSRKN